MKFTHKQKSKKLRASAMLGPIVFWTLLGLSSLYTKNHNEKIIKNYIKNDLKYEMANQEQILGIKYLGTPNIEYHMQPEIINLAPGAYDAETDTIYINLHLLTERKSLKQDLLRVKKTLNHELGHFYTDKLSERLGKKDLFKFARGENYLGVEVYPERLILEGIAEYFDIEVNGGAHSFKDTDWPTDLDAFNKTTAIYLGGYHLVKPIIDLYGEKGIECLIQNMPTKEDLLDIPEYQNKILGKLEEKTMWFLFE
ncbi:hypothetical protein J4225_00800 [Candidatus Pacearchaeota archaeon]|nr:hypothetical protein [Candidatus Pacearchaeota archaeon]